MNLPKTVKGYISLIRKIEKKSLLTLKGFDKLPENDKNLLKELDAEISNLINEVESYN